MTVNMSTTTGSRAARSLEATSRGQASAEHWGPLTEAPQSVPSSLQNQEPELVLPESGLSVEQCSGADSGPPPRPPSTHKFQHQPRNRFGFRSRSAGGSGGVGGWGGEEFPAKCAVKSKCRCWPDASIQECLKGC